MHNTNKNIGSVIGFFGVIGGIIYGFNVESLVAALFVAIPSLITSVFFIGFAELLESVRKIQVHLTGEDDSTPLRLVNNKTKISDRNIKE